MTDEKYLELKKSGIYNKQAKVLLELNELYHKYLYLCSIKSIREEKIRLNNIFNQK